MRWVVVRVLYSDCLLLPQKASMANSLPPSVLYHAKLRYNYRPVSSLFAHCMIKSICSTVSPLLYQTFLVALQQHETHRSLRSHLPLFTLLLYCGPVNSLYIRQAPSKHYAISPPDNRHPAALPDTSIRPLGPSPHRHAASYKAVQRSYGIALERVQDFERLHGDDYRNYNNAASIM